MQIVGVIGLVSNGLSMFIFYRQRVHKIFHNLLLTLAVFDTASSSRSELVYRDEIIYWAKVSVLFCFEICTSGGGAEKGGKANFKTKHIINTSTPVLCTYTGCFTLLNLEGN